MSAALQELSNTFLDSDFLKGLIDSGTEGIETITKLVDTIGGVPTAIGIAAAGFTIFKNKGRDKHKQFSLSLNMPVMSDREVERVYCGMVQ